MKAQTYDILDAGPRNRFMVSGRIVHNCTGDGPQPTNFPKAGPHVWRCQCGRHYGESRLGCPWCGAGPEGRIDYRGQPLEPGAKPNEWSPEAMADAIEVVRLGDLATLEMFFGDAFLTLAGCLRGTFIAAPGHDLVSSDWTAIEAVVLACLAGEQWRIDLFRQGGKIYEASGAKVGRMQYEEVLEYKKRTGQHHPIRQVGKTCLTADTQVLTDSGVKPILAVRLTDRLWDGTQWVKHEGVLPQGTKRVINLDGVRMTPDHKINTGRSWKEARQLVSSEKIRYLSYSHGLESLPSSALNSGRRGALKRFKSPAAVGRSRTRFFSAICCVGDQHGATLAPKRRRPAFGKSIGGTPTLSPTPSTAKGSSTASQRRLVAAIGRAIPPGQITGAEGFRYMSAGATVRKAAGRGFRTSCRFPAGMSPNSTWTESTRTGATSPGIFALRRKRKTRTTNGKSRTCRGSSTSFEPVFDIVNAGPLRRFTILTDAGPLIVSNCELALGYQGWVGAWRAFDPKGTQSDNELRDIILAWREASPAIVEFWGGQSRRTPGGWKEEFYGVEGAFIQAILNPGREFDCRGLKFQMAGDCLYLTLLSGRRIAYHAPRLHSSDKLGCRYSVSYWGWNTNPKNGPRGWIQIYTWGGRIVENIVQATSNDILRFTSVNLERAGYPIVLHVYDEIVCEVLRGVGSVEELEAWMRYLPPWARCPDGQRWPVGAAGGWRAERYRKG